MKTLAANSYLNFSPSKFRDYTTTIRALAFVGHQKQLSFGTISQRNKICSLSAIPSEVDDEGGKLQITEDPGKTVRVRFVLQKQCGFGEQFLIVGDDPVLASWKPSDGVPLNWSDGHVWAVELDMPSGKVINYKFLLEGITGTVLWQPGPDRILETWDTEKVITVFEDWDAPELQSIVESDAGEDSVISSSLLTVEENLSPEIEEDVNDLGKELENTNGYYTENAAKASVTALLVAENILLAEKDEDSNNTGFESDTDSKIVNSSNLVSSGDEPKLVYDEGIPVLVPGLISAEPEKIEEASANEVETGNGESILNSMNEVEEITVPDETTEVQELSTSFQYPTETMQQMLETKTQDHDNEETESTILEGDMQQVSTSHHNVTEIAEQILETKAQDHENEETESIMLDGNMQQVSTSSQHATETTEQMFEAKTQDHDNEETESTILEGNTQQVFTSSQHAEETTEKMLETKQQDNDIEATESTILEGNMQWGRQTIQKFLACLGL